jgi:hypothetical protein
MFVVLEGTTTMIAKDDARRRSKVGTDGRARSRRLFLLYIHTGIRQLE